MIRLQFDMKGRKGTINFQRIAVLIGPNGSGKSTISDALCLSLVGESYDLFWREKAKSGRLLKYMGRNDTCFSKVVDTFSGEEWEWKIDEKRRAPRDYIERVRPWRRALSGNPATLISFLAGILGCQTLTKYQAIYEQLALARKANKETAAYYTACSRFAESLVVKGDSTSRLHAVKTARVIGINQEKRFKQLLVQTSKELSDEVNANMDLLLVGANNFMPNNEVIRWNDSDSIFFLQKNGVDRYFLSKSEETRVIGSLALGSQDTANSILVLEDRGWDGVNLRTTLKLWSESSAARIIIQSTVKPAARPYKNVTYVRMGELFEEE